jgi:hypothetical protein
MNPDDARVELVPEQVDPIKYLIEDIERDIHAGGWDRPAVFITLSVADFKEIGQSCITAKTMDMPNSVYENPGEEFPALVRGLIKAEEDPDDPRTGADAAARHHANYLTRGFMGVGMFFEGYHLEADGKEVTNEELQAVAEHRLLNQHPLAVESRMGLVYTIDGRLMAISRDRGKEDVTVTEVGVDDTRKLMGDVPKALCNFCRYLESWVPRLVERGLI